jgi:hypothetical protein
MDPTADQGETNRDLEPPQSPPKGSPGGLNEPKPDEHKDESKREVDASGKLGRRRWFDWYNKLRKRVLNPIVGVLTLIIGYWLLSQTQRQADISRDAVNVAREALQFQKSTDSVNRISQNRKDSLSENSQNFRDAIALKNFRLENRAYLTIGANFHPAELQDESLPIYFWITNVGQTPAYQTRIMFAANRDSISEEFFRTFYTPITDSGRMIGSGISDTSVSIVAKTTWKPAVYNGTGLCIAVLVSYRDIFHQPHRVSAYSRYSKEGWRTMYTHNGGD